MSRAQGFMIPLNFNDWFIGHGDRTNWCSAQTWWTNENISLQGSSLGTTEAKVGDTVTIAVGIQGVVDQDGVREFIQHVQAWACYPSPTAGRSSASLVLPSMQSSNPAFASSNQTLLPSSDATDYQNLLDAPYFLASLSPTWTPPAADRSEE